MEQYGWCEKNKRKQQLSGKNGNRVNGIEKWMKVLLHGQGAKKKKDMNWDHYDFARAVSFSSFF